MSSEIQFCADCSNLLYPKEDKEHKQLIFLCRSCDYLQYADPYSATQNCVDRINYNFRSKEDVNSYIAQGLGHDPTLPRAPHWKCPKCPHTGAVYFHLPERVAEDAMTLVFVCRSCTFYQVKGKESGDNDKEADVAQAEEDRVRDEGSVSIGDKERDLVDANKPEISKNSPDNEDEDLKLFGEDEEDEVPDAKLEDDELEFY